MTEIKLPQRKQNSHKGTYGKVLNIAGSPNYSGAAYLSSISALKVGCGYVALASCPSVLQAVSAKSPDIVLIPRPERNIPVIVLELKYDETADTAINQIKDKRYSGLLKDFSNDIVLVGINYSKTTKKHECVIETI